MTSTVLQSGTITRNHLATWAAPGVIGDAGSSLTPGVSSLGIFSNGGLPLSISNTSTPGEPSGPYSQLGFGISQTAAYLNVQSYNGAAPLPLEFIINGVTSFAIAANGSIIINSLTLSTPLGVPSGGTGLSTIPSPGQLLVGNGTGYSLQTLSAGTGINITNFTTIGLANTGTAGTYALPTITVNPQGQVTSAINSPTTGTGNVVLSNSPTLTTPNLGTPSSLTLTNAVGLPNSGLINNSITINGTAVPLGGTTTIAAGLAVGSTPITGGTSGDLLYENGSTLGQLAIGSGLAVASGTLSATGSGGTVTNIATGTGLTGGPITSTGTISLANTTVTAGSYGNAANVATFTVNAQGQITTAGTTAISIPASAINTTIPNSGLTNSSITINGSTVALGGSTTVTAVNPYALTLGTGLSGTSYNGSAAVTAAIANTGVVAGSYGGSTSIPVVTVNAQGQITNVTTAAVGGGTVTSVQVSGDSTGMTFTGGPITTAGTITMGGTLGVGYGGTGLVTAPANGQMLIGNGTNYTLNTLTAGSGISITNAAGSITITSTGGGGSVTSVAASGGTTGLTFSGSPITTAGTITLGGTLAVASGGTGGTATPTAGGVAYGTGSAYAFTTVGSAGQFLQSNGAFPPSWSTASTPIGSPGYWGSFWDTTSSLTLSAAYAIGIVPFGYTDSNSNGTSITSGSRVTVANAGVYNFQFSLQFQNSDTAIHNAFVWLRLNGSDVADTTGDIAIPNSHGGIPGLTIASWNYVLKLNAGDYLQLAWSSDSSGNQITVITSPAGTSPTVYPETPAAIATIVQLTQIGLGYYGLTSSSSVTIGTGSKSFTTNLSDSQDAFTIGSRVRVAYSTTPSNFMEGVITGYSGTSLTVNVDTTGGSGTYASWTFSIAGQNGLSAITVGTSTVSGGTSGRVLYDNAGVVGEYSTVPTANGGTGLSSFTANGAVYATSTSALTTGTLPPTGGGTGVNNGTNTLTLAGNMTLSGAFATTLNVTGTTSVTLPTTGTLATTANTVASFSAGSTGLTPSTATTGAVTLGGTLAAANGGTGLTGFTAANNAIYSSSSSTLTAGTLPVAAGGTGATTLTGVLKGNGTSAFTAATAGTDYVAPGTATTFTAVQTFTNSDLALLGSSTGFTTFTSANTSATNYTLTIPAASGTVALSTTVPGSTIYSANNFGGL